MISILAGQLFDLFDGRMAEKHGGTKLGPWLDDIADFVSFGICPAIMIAVRGEWQVLAFLAGSFYLISVAYRLWRFLKQDKQDKTLPPGVFRGLPSPAGTIMIFGACLYCQNKIVLWLFVLITSLLMISNYKFSHFGRVILRQLPKALVVLFRSEEHTSELQSH